MEALGALRWLFMAQESRRSNTMISNHCSQGSTLLSTLSPPTCSDPEEGEESHPEGSEVSVFAQSLAGVLLVTF